MIEALFGNHLFDLVIFHLRSQQAAFRLLSIGVMGGHAMQLLWLCGLVGRSLGQAHLNGWYLHRHRDGASVSHLVPDKDLIASER